MPPLPPIVPARTILEWLPEVFAEGTPHRTYVVRELAANTLFVMLYIGAIEGTGRYMRPDQVTKMTDRQSECIGDEAREKWCRDSLTPGAMLDLQGRWYAANTREPIRDETLRNGLIALGAVVERKDLPTTSAKPRYSISRHFAELLLALHGNPPNAKELIGEWQKAHLSQAALSRIHLIRRGTVQSTSADRISVTFPNGEVRLMLPGPSTVISKAIIEEFCPRFMREAGVVFLSESGDKVVARDDLLARSIGLNLDYGRNLPDIILADVSVESPKVIFVEVVASDGPINEGRKEALQQVAESAGYDHSHIYFISAFMDRGASAFRKLVAEIAWGTFVWFVSEPDKLLIFKQGSGKELSSLLDG
jgi:BsuBI/PstI restriction endonuclease C-terminus.